MPTYAYNALDSSGQEVLGFTKADNVEEAHATLIRQGLSVIDIEEREDPKTPYLLPEPPPVEPCGDFRGQYQSSAQRKYPQFHVFRVVSTIATVAATLGIAYLIVTGSRGTGSQVCFFQWHCFQLATPFALAKLPVLP